jgi:hypothetical protein
MSFPDDLPAGKRLAWVVERFSDVLGPLHEAARKTHCRAIDWSRFRADFWYAEHIRLLLAAETLVHLDAGRGAEAIESLSCLLGIGQVLGYDPRLQKWAEEWSRDALWILRGLAQRVRLPNDGLQKLVSQMQVIDFQHMITTRLVAERADIFTRVDRWRRGTLGYEGYSHPAPDPRERWIAPFMWYRDEARLVAMLTDMVNASRLPTWQAMPKLISLSERGRGKPLWLRPMRWYFYRGYVPIEIYRAWTLRDASVIGLSCELFQSAKGRYPATLDQLAPEFLKEVPTDPFTGKPFKYELRNDGAAFIVYSLGDNLKNDGGVELPAKDDISWEGRARAGR